MDFTMFRERLQRLFEGQNLTLNNLAADMHISSASLSRYLSGKRSPDLASLVLMAKYFNVSMEWLLGLTDGATDTLAPEVREIADLYSIANPEDRAVIDMVLRKYHRSEGEQG